MLELLLSVEKLWSIPFGLLASICSYESNLNPNLFFMDGRTYSVGLCSIKLSAARETYKQVKYGPNIRLTSLINPVLNANAAAGYLVKKYNKYKRWDYAVLAYNAGRVKFVGRWPINEEYLKRVEKRWKQF